MSNKIPNNKCECGAEQKGKVTIFITEHQEVCPTCGKLNYIEYAPIDWGKIAEGNNKPIVSW